jgi:MFS family permease
MDNLVNDFSLSSDVLAHLTSAVQFGFITGTLVFAVLTLADRFSPSKVFFYSALAGALFNLGTIFPSNTLATLISWRFMTGFCLAGIYPVGMKIAADYFQKGLGKSLGFLVGALVLGTAFPHLLKAFATDLPWKSVLIATSLLAVTGGGLILLFVPDGPFRKAVQKPDFTAIFKVFQNRNFRAAAFGYFGHMWELYAFWAFVPIMLMNKMDEDIINFNVSILSFFIIGLGSLSCVFGGYVSLWFGVKKTAFTALLLSGFCCMLSPVAFHVFNENLFIAFLIFWGLVVIMDSPLFSTLVAQNAVAENKGTALTIVNCIGFSITIISIQWVSYLLENWGMIDAFVVLAIGPILGLIAFISNRKKMVGDW